MSTRNLTRAFLSTAKPLNAVLSHSCTTAASSSAVIPKSSFIFRLRPLSVAASPSCFRRIAPAPSSRGFSTRPTSSSLNDPNPNWSNRPPKETIMLDGCDFEHWLVVVEKPEGDTTRDDIIDGYIKTLATVVGSEEEARMKIYSVSTRCYFAFGALVSEELSYKLKELPNVRWVLPDSYLDVKNKDYGGEPFIDGRAVPYDPKYHEEWERNNARANDRNRRNDRPRNHDRPRNFERRREIQNNNNYNAGSNAGGGSPMGGPPRPMQNFAPPVGGPPQNFAPPMGGPPQNFAPPMGGPPAPPQNFAPPMGAPPAPPQNFASPNPGGVGMPQNNNPAGNYPPSRAPANNNAPNYQYGPSGRGPYQSGPGQMGPGQVQNHNNAYPPNMGGGSAYQGQNVPAQPLNRGYGQGQNVEYVPGPNRNYGQSQNGYAPNVGPGEGQNQGGYGSQNVPGRDPNY